MVTAPADAGLPPDYALLGRVAEGFATIERIEALVGPDGRPDPRGDRAHHPAGRLMAKAAPAPGGTEELGRAPAARRR